MDYPSFVTHQSQVAPGVSYELARLSFGRRLELMAQVREMSQRREFLAAGDEPREYMQVAEMSLSIERLYFRWGLRAVYGLNIDGQPATPEALWEHGPAALTNEILLAIHQEIEFTEEKQKNC